MKGKSGEAGGKQPKKSGLQEKGGGNPRVMAEAGLKRGGKAQSAMHGAKAKHRLDKPGRKLGGRAGSDKSPLSSANTKSSGFMPS